MAEERKLERKIERKEPTARIAMDRTVTNPRTGESETWHDVGALGENRPVAKTLPEVIVTPDNNREAAARRAKIEGEAMADRNRAKREAAENSLRRIERPKPEPEGRLMRRAWRIDPETGEKIEIIEEQPMPAPEYNGPAEQASPEEIRRFRESQGERFPVEAPEEAPRSIFDVARGRE